MNPQRLNALAIYDISGNQVTGVPDHWPEPSGDGFYRWIHLDLNDPSAKPWIKDKLPEIAARSLLQSETRPRCERFDQGVILNLRGVNLNPQSDLEDMVSLRVWATKDTIVTARLRKVWALEQIRQTAVAGAAPPSVGAFLAELAYGLVARIETVSLSLEEQTDELEEISSGGSKSQPGRISALRQTVIKMRRFINPQREAVTNLSQQEDWIMVPHELALLRETANKTRRIVEELDATRDRLSALQDHLEAEQAQSFSRNSYVLSVIAAIFLPLGFLTGLFGVNVGGMPGVESGSAFWILSIVSALVGAALYAAFKASKWL